MYPDFVPAITAVATHIVSDVYLGCKVFTLLSPSSKMYVNHGSGPGEKGVGQLGLGLETVTDMTVRYARTDDICQPIFK